MDIGIGIPNSVPGTTGEQLLDWARLADSAGFSTLSSIGAVSYPGYEELSVYAAAGAVTERIRFMTNVLITPPRSTAELAKQSATVNELTGGRLTLGVSVGWREPDYLLTGRDYHTRGRLFDEQLQGLRRAWAGEALLPGTRPVVPTAAQGPGVPLLIGGTTDATIRRVAEFGIGWTAGGTMFDATFSAFVEKLMGAWREAGRDGTPKLVAMTYYSLDVPDEQASAYVLDYYEPMGGGLADMIAGTVLRSPQAIKETVSAAAEAGIDELILSPTVSDLAQVQKLADAAL
jgi:alkanesulfonate monooxygenase SsuD/methylene tetrahydromethanopterin reductase-like flavin-dependent oxidoreductase (luciferase family)